MYLIVSVTDESETSAFDSQSSSVIRLNNSTIIFMKEVSNVLAMICIWREENFGKSGQYQSFYQILFCSYYLATFSLWRRVLYSPDFKFPKQSEFEMSRFQTHV